MWKLGAKWFTEFACFWGEVCGRVLDMATKDIYEVRAYLIEYEPEIWRTFHIRGDATMASMAYTLMTLFEMRASHLYAFNVPLVYNTRNANPDMSEEELDKLFPTEESAWQRYERDRSAYGEAFSDLGVIDVAKAKLATVLKAQGDMVVFEYDFGDGWAVAFTLEKILDGTYVAAKELPKVIEGQGFGILEDCGGTQGLEDIAKQIAKKKGEEYQHWCEWTGIRVFDLEKFNIRDMQGRLQILPKVYKGIFEKGRYPTAREIDIIERRVRFY